MYSLSPTQEQQRKNIETQSPQIQFCNTELHADKQTKVGTRRNFGSNRKIETQTHFSTRTSNRISSSSKKKPTLCEPHALKFILLE